MKYDTDVDLSNDNTSHAMVAALVGQAKRVLDVGCSTGYLARILRGNGNAVSGVEIDSDAAEQARPVLDKLVVGDVESMDFSEHFDEGSFDVVVFADVLEHVRDPASVLRRTSGLLAPGGSVILSIPNVAHGSVRLALLEGRFEYRPLGLLDDTHLRFFTRSSLDAMLASAGFRALEVRRTTADAFTTEIPLTEDHFSAEVVERVRADPESFTYQFVLRAVPEADVATSDMLGLFAARSEELEAFGAQVKELLALAQGFVAPPCVGVLATTSHPQSSESPWQSLRTSVTVAELRRRLLHSTVRLVAIGEDAKGAPQTNATPTSPDPTSPDLAANAADWSGEPVEHLGNLRGGGAANIAHDFDALVVVDPATAPSGLGSIEAHGCPVRTLDTAAALPDLLVLSERVAAGTSLSLRLDYLRAAGKIPTAPKYMLVSAGSANQARVRSLSRVVDQLATDSDSAVWVLASHGPYADPGASKTVSSSIKGARIVDGLAEIDLLAVIAGADMVVTDCAGPAALAMSLRRPLLCVEGDQSLGRLAKCSGDPALVASKPSDLLSLVQIATRRAEDRHIDDQVATPIDLAFDELASSLERAATRRFAASLPEALSGMRRRIERLERANAASARRMASERNALGRRAIALAGGAAPDDSAGMLVERAERKREEAEQAARSATEAYEAVMATKTMRLLSPARRAYGLLRGGQR